MSKHIKLIQSLSLGLVLAVTVATGCGFLTVGCYELYDAYMERRTPAQRIQAEGFRVLSDGRALIEVYNISHPPYRPKYLDLHRKPVQLPDEPEWLEGAYLPERYRLFLGINRSGPQARILSVAQALHGTEDWYFVFEDKSEGHGYFVAFDFRNRERLGYLGKQGFQKDPLSKAEQFSVDGLGMVNSTKFRSAFLSTSDGLAFLQSENKLFLINLKTRTVRLLIGDKKVLSIATLNKPGATQNDGQSIEEALLAVRTENQVLLLDFSGEQRQKFIIPSELQTRGFGYYLLPNGNALMESYSGNRRDAGSSYIKFDTDLFWATPQGEVTQRHVFTRWIPRSIQHLSERAEACLVTMAVPAPVAGGTMALVALPWRDSLLYEKPYAVTVAESFQDAWPALLSLLILAAGLTYLTDRRQRKFGLPRSYAWLVFVFLLGLPGYIAYLVHRPWPIRQSLPPPEQTGLEIFA